MGLGDMVNKAKEMAGQHPDQVDKGLDKGSELVKGRTPDQYDEKVDRGADKAGEFLTGGHGDGDAPQSGQQQP